LICWFCYFCPNFVNGQQPTRLRFPDIPELMNTDLPDPDIPAPPLAAEELHAMWGF
jgi:hypothetical protein